MRNIWTIARREYNHFFASPIAYVVAFAVLLIVGAIFALVILDASQSAFGGFGAPPAPDMRAVVWWFNFMIILSAPALTMRLISEEHRMGTVELLLTAPIRDWELVIGKWLGGFLFMLTIIAVTLIYPLILNGLEKPGIDQGQMMSAYLGLILLSAALLGLGVGISSLFNNQIAAFFATLAVFIFLTWIVSFLSQISPGGKDVFAYLSMNTHFDSLNSGAINLSDLVYFLSLTVLGLFTGAVAVEFRRWS
ncbi:MAG: ABC transporter permease subunit [Chloroflexi bacterium]|nr:ABC transporter permease subunit [Chloroflexota bacterium]